MKKIGIIGGLGPESTLIYYKGIINAFTPTYSQTGYPEISIESMDLKSIVHMMQTGAWDDLADAVAKHCAVLEKGGAEFGAIASNSPHKVFAEIQSMTALPLINIVEAVCDYSAKNGLKRLGLMGTQSTMSSNFYQHVFGQRDIQLVCPLPEEQRYIQHKLDTEIEFGVFKEDTKTGLLSIIGNLHHKHRLDGVIMGCTELPLVIKPEDIDLHYVNSTDIHISAIVAKCRS